MLHCLSRFKVVEIQDWHEVGIKNSVFCQESFIHLLLGTCTAVGMKQFCCNGQSKVLDFCKEFEVETLLLFFRSLLYKVD